MVRQSLAPQQSRAPTVLLTRPAAQNQRFAEQLQDALGPLQIVQSPLMAPEFLQPDLTGRIYTALILSSETGVEAARRLLAAGQDLPQLAFCVGDQTAKIAQSIGLNALSAKGDANDLIALVLAHAPKGPLLHLCGEDQRGEIAKSVTNGGIETDSRTAYVQRPQPLTEDACMSLGENRSLLVPIFSPRSAQLLAQMMPDDRQAPLWIAAISPATAEVAKALKPARLAIADRPDAKAMLQKVADLISLATDA